MKKKQSHHTSSRSRGGRRSMSLYAEGEPMVWLTGGALGFSLLMIMIMLLYVFWMGFSNFWPQSVMKVTTHEGAVHMGTVNRVQNFQVSAAILGALEEQAEEEKAQGIQVARVQADHILENESMSTRMLLYTGNYDITGTRFQWVSDYQISTETEPEWAILVERLMDGNFYGNLVAFTEDGEVVTEDPAEAWRRFQSVHPDVRRRFRERERIRTIDMGRVNRNEESARLRLITETRRFENDQTTAEQLEKVRLETEEAIAVTRREHAELSARVDEINVANRKYGLVFETAQGVRHTLLLDSVVRAFPANQISTGQKIRIFAGRWREFLLDNPREANMEGGVYPAIVGTVTMTLVMSIFVVPFGVLAALYLREYAKPGPIVSAVRIAINNLAGVPSIVFGVFGLGFFCYIMGGHMDELFYAVRLPTPTFRKGGVLWASLTLALLTLPVVIVATEEALSAVPSSMREGSYACGASKWQTIKRIVLPRSMPGIMTGMILAMARGAGEVAPLMLVGAVKLAPSLPLDIHDWSGTLGFIPTGPIHLERSFLHLGFHIYDLGFQSSDSEAARPMVYTTTLLLITIIVVLNLSAIMIRTRLRKKFETGNF
ncbi:MAG: phosphate ABC transporter permease PstA [Verrucomicrobia bacterium]|nr:phosphate ABC transporter permease PstA [Verrucomicrobiota bacterium]MCH8514106.1 phosphate ABC transporter permease PstA [Kiritimatiellia bacterium]